MQSSSTPRSLFTLTGTRTRDPAVEQWLRAHDGPLGEIARHWFAVMRTCGNDVRETLHDGQPTACVGGAAFAYVDAFTAHVNVGFFRGASLADPAGLLTGTGRSMRHVKVTPAGNMDDAALSELISEAYADLKRALGVS